MDKQTEILIAAKKVFMQKGYDGARMQEIADEAGINKALLHYYFRSKDGLFKMVMKDALGVFFPAIISAVVSDLSMEERLDIFFEKYIDFMQENPEMPRFILFEVAKNPSLIQEFLAVPRENDALEKLKAMIARSRDKGEIKDIDAVDFILNLISLCVFPILAKPLLSNFLGISPVEFDEYIGRRKKSLPNFFINGMR